MLELGDALARNLGQRRDAAATRACICPNATASRRCRRRRSSTCSARRRRPANILSPTLTRAVEDTLAQGEQAMLFLNRRGFAPLTLCKACGHKIGCPRCTSWLVEHRYRRKLVLPSLRLRSPDAGLAAPNARRWAPSSPAAPASNASPKKWRANFPNGAHQHRLVRHDARPAPSPSSRSKPSPTTKSTS